MSFATTTVPECHEERIIQWDFGERHDWHEYSGAGDSDVDNRPRSLAVDSKGNIYIGDSVNYQVVKFDNKGSHLLTVPLQKPLVKEPELGYVIASLAVDSNDDLYVLNFYARRIEVYSPTGQFKRQFSITLSDLYNMYGNKLDIGIDGNVYVYSSSLINLRDSIYSKSGKEIKILLEETSPNYFKDQKFIRYNGYSLSIENMPIKGDIVDMISLHKDNQLIGKCGPLHLEDESANYIDRDGNIFLFESAKINAVGTLSNSLDVLKIKIFSVAH